MNFSTYSWSDEGCQASVPLETPSMTKVNTNGWVWAASHALIGLLLRCNGTQCHLHKELGLSEVRVKK